MRRTASAFVAPIGLAAIGLAAVGCAEDEPIARSAPPTTPVVLASTDTHDHPPHDEPIDGEVLRSAYLGAAAFQDVAVAEAAGWASTLDTLGCFENPDLGGMGVHWLNEALLDDVVDPARPEALVYELDARGAVVGLVGHEYLVPLDAWTAETPPSLFGVDFHPHPVLPFWILHAYLWKPNPNGMFADWNPTVRMCPEGVTVFGTDSDPDESEQASSEGAVS